MSDQNETKLGSTLEAALNPPKLRIDNPSSYSPADKPVSPFRKTFTLSVEAVLDGVPGAFNQPEDLMNWINTNPYVRFVVLEKDPA